MSHLGTNTAFKSPKLLQKIYSIHWAEQRLYCVQYSKREQGTLFCTLQQLGTKYGVQVTKDDVQYTVQQSCALWCSVQYSTVLNIVNKVQKTLYNTCIFLKNRRTDKIFTYVFRHQGTALI